MSLDKEFADFCINYLNKGLTSEKLFTYKEVLHAAIGVATETAEMLVEYEATLNTPRNKRDFTKAVKEAGDVCFYLIILMHEFSIVGTDIDNTICYPIDVALKRDTIDLLELVKKYVFQERAELHNSIANYIVTIKSLLTAFIEVSLHSNTTAATCYCVDKLTKRYASGQFSVAQSRERTV